MHLFERVNEAFVIKIFQDQVNFSFLHRIFTGKTKHEMMIQKIKRQKFATARASAWYTLSNIIGRGAGVIFTPIFTRILSPAEYGIYSLYTSWIGIFTVICTLEISGSVMYRALSHFDEDESTVSSAFAIEAVLLLLFLTVYIIFRRYINRLTDMTTNLTLFLLVQIFLNSVLGIYFARKRYFCDYKSVALINTATGILTPILSLVLISSGIRGMSRVIAPLIITAVFAVPIFFKGKTKNALFDLERWKYILKLSLPMLPHYLALSVIASADKIIISHIMPDGSVGKYSAAYAVGFIISIITSGISSALIPHIMRSLAENGRYKGEERLSLICDGTVALILLFLSALPEIFGLAVPREYFDAFSSVYFTAISVFFLFLSGILSSAVLHYEKPMKITKNSILSAALFLILAFSLIDSFGYLGGALATLIGYMTLFFLNFITFRRESGYDLLNMKNCLQNAGFLFFFGVLFFVLKQSPVSRFLLAVAVILIFLPRIKKKAGF